MPNSLPPHELRTDRVLVRCYQPGDGPLLARAVNSSREHLREHVPWARVAMSQPRAERRVRDCCADFLLARSYAFAILSPDGKRLLGGTSFRPERHRREERAEIGMWIAADAARSGLGTHVLCNLLSWGFSRWPWQRLLWLCDVGNHASAAVATKCWMRKTGIVAKDHLDLYGNWRDSLRFEAVRSDWQRAATAESAAASTISNGVEVVLDPGHGGHEPIGRSTPYGVFSESGAAEKDICLALAQQVSRHLPGSVALTRAGDHNLSLAERAQRARDADARVFVSIHAGHASRAGGDGAQGSPMGGPGVWVHPNASCDSLSLARALAERMPGRVPVRSGLLAVLTPDRLAPRTAACLVEAGSGMVAHPGDSTLLSLGQRLAGGISQFAGYESKL